MSEPTRPEPPPESGPDAIAGASRLSPVQQAWSDYVGHSLRCGTCRSIDGGKCGTADMLYGAYQEQGANAYGRLAEEAP
ncbi:hypothetical protein SGFS_012630 [Streptomyces graminofaciens]|uniref:Uncharacterized protein n=1 Tax=Streptomyces graminofaciens TaxID=68212 RepID=A0ABM7F2K4_9ACTN|nr:hypothetical protein [Streptomyces graminofaciens]BBC29969.1 hypothetical protein SGFS_012630 [Streptomyces graminofaciens]